MRKKRKKSKLNTANKRFYKVNREHKSSLFCLSFREKKYLLEIYNAMNGTDYQNTEELTVCTLEDAVYIGIKNDISFLLGEMLNLYEHQSTQNPNMPMRGLLYLARNYEAYIAQNELNMYGTAQIEFPLPQYFVFYNGREEEADRRELKLTDAVDEAIDGCIREDILKDLLVKSRAEVRNMVLSTFNKEQYERDLKKEAERKGLEEGLAKGRAEGERIGKEKMNAVYEKLMESGRMEEMTRAFRDEVYREKLLEEFSEQGL